MGTLSKLFTHIGNTFRCTFQPLPYCSDHFSWKDLFSRSKCLGLTCDEPDDICLLIGRSMSWTPPSSISDAGYRFLFATCRLRDPFSLLSKISLYGDIVLSQWLTPFIDGFPITYQYLWYPSPPLASLQYGFRLPTCNLPYTHFLPQAATALSNSTAIQEVFKRTAQTVSPSSFNISFTQ
jgi:hypothetical protein